LAEGLNEAAAGHGSRIVISGPAGSGRRGWWTDLARERDILVLAARDGELEHEVTLGGGFGGLAAPVTIGRS
jgi:hypothetical protein